MPISQSRNKENIFFLPATKFWNHCLDFSVFGSTKDLLKTLCAPVIAPMAFTLVAVVSLLASIHFLIKGDFAKSGLYLLLFAGYGLLVPLSPVLAVSNILIRSSHSLYNLSKTLFRAGIDLLTNKRLQNSHNDLHERFRAVRPQRNSLPIAKTNPAHLANESSDNKDEPNNFKFEAF